MVIEQIPVDGENEEKNDLSQKEKVVDSAEHSSEENVVELNDNPKLAKEEADKIAEGLPDTIDQLSPEQQKQFVDLVEHDINWVNLNLAPKNVENVPDLLPPYWQQQVDVYKDMRNNISKLPPDKQEALKKAEKEAISQMTEDSGKALESGWVTMPWESEPVSAPNTEPYSTAPEHWGEWNSGSEWWEWWID